MAAESIKSPAAFPCETCNCVDGIASEPTWKVDGRIKPTRKCFRYATAPRSKFILLLYTHYKRGVLMYDGGLMEQPAFYAAAMSFLEGYLSAS